jgi:hypothetical protein
MVSPNPIWRRFRLFLNSAFFLRLRFFLAFFRRGPILAFFHLLIAFLLPGDFLGSFLPAISVAGQRLTSLGLRWRNSEA